jgi:hypothetical protein
MTGQTFFNLALLAVLAVLALNTASIARSLRRVERIEHHRMVGWHLMRPPMAPIIAKYARSIHLNENPAAPLSQWTIVETFPTQEECEAYRRCQGFNGPLIATTGRFIVLRDQRMCIPADDPRLKEK